MKFILYLFSITTFSSSAFAQDFGIEMWRDHLPYSNVIGVVKDGTKAYGATPFGLFYYDQEDNSLTRFNKINGLNDFQVTSLGYNSGQKTVIVGYDNGNVDLIIDDVVFNINAILVSNVLGSKSINSIHSEGNLSYLACGFGIVVLDLLRKEVKESYIFGPNGITINVNDITTSSSKIIASTDNGIYTANKNSNFLSDFNQWSKVTSLQNNNVPYSTLHFQNNNLFAVMKISGYATDSLFIFDENFTVLQKQFNDDFFGIESKGTQTILCKNVGFTILNSSLAEEEVIYTYAGNNAISPNQCIWDGTSYWIADRFTSLNKSESNWSTVNYGLAGPHTNNCFQMASNKNYVWIASGTVDGSGWNNTYNSNGFMSFDKTTWKRYDRNSYSVLAGDSIYDYTHVAINPKNENHVIASTFTKGIVEFKDGNFVKNYSHYNSSLQVSLVHGNNQVKVGASVFDKDENIWVINSYTNNPLTVITKSGDSQSFSCGSAANNTLLTNIIYIEQTGHLWISIRGKGIIVYDFNDTPLDPSDDQFILLNGNEGSGNLPSVVVNAMIEDKNGEIWVGTEKGPAVFYNPSGVFQSNFTTDAQKVLLEQDGVFNFLLEEQNITSIVVDGADRKWFGTSGGGVFLMSPDGTKQVYAFSTSNSPIFSNGIISMAMNQQTGELFIGTDRGVIGFKGTATEPKNSFNDVYAFPNPVRPDFDGPIAIRGLMDKSDVKITDSRGNLVYSTVSNGGQAIWNGKNYQDERVATGVYYIFVVDQNGASKSSTKILFIN